jgi:hypothetical protein
VEGISKQKCKICPESVFNYFSLHISCAGQQYACKHSVVQGPWCWIGQKQLLAGDQESGSMCCLLNLCSIALYAVIRSAVAQGGRYAALHS